MSKSRNKPPTSVQKQTTKQNCLAVWVGSDPWHTNLPLKCFSCLYFFIIFLAAYGGILHSKSGRHFLLAAEAANRANLIAVPVAERGTVWNIREKLDSVIVQLPLFAFGYNGDRLAYYNDMQATLGDVTPFAKGLAIHTHQRISEILESTNQPRGRFLGARIGK